MKCSCRTLILFIACCIAGTALRAQVVSRSTDTVSKAKQHQPAVIAKQKGPKPISREISIGYRLNSDGWSAYTDIGRVKAKDLKHSDMFYKVSFWQIEFTEKKNPKEYKSSGQGSGHGSNKYIYGKINNFYALKLGRGYMKMLVGKPDPGSVSIHWLNAGGFSLGILKPYYLNVYSDPNAIKYDDATKSDFLNQGLIEGSAGFSKGLGEVKIIPGFHFKTALHFDFSANRKNVIGVETGINGEYYTQDVQIMANRPPTAYFVDIYLGLQVGKRW